MEKRHIFFGNFSKIEIEFYKPETIFINGNLSLKKIKSNKDGYYFKDYEKLYFSQGRKIKEESKNLDSDSILTTFFSYDKNYNLIDIKTSYSGTPNDFFYNYKFEFDLKNQKIKEEKKEMTINRWENYYTYDTSGNLLKEQWISRDYPLIDFFYKYDSLGNNISKVGKYLLGQIETFLIIDSKFDSENRLTFEHQDEFKDHRGNMITTTELYYGEYDNLVTRKVIKEKGFSFLDKDTYFQYDSYGNLISEKNHTISGNIDEKKWHYKYDENFNWISCIEFLNEVPKLIITRKFYK